MSVIEFWSMQRGDELIEQTFPVVGSGQEVEGQWAYVGTAVVPGGVLVWHLATGGRVSLRALGRGRWSSWTTSTPCVPRRGGSRRFQHLLSGAL